MNLRTRRTVRAARSPATGTARSSCTTPAVTSASDTPSCYGAWVESPDGQPGEAGRSPARMGSVREPDPRRGKGIAKFVDIIEGQTMREQVDEFTGLASKVIVEAKDPALQPRISSSTPNGGSSCTTSCCRWAPTCGDRRR